MHINATGWNRGWFPWWHLLRLLVGWWCSPHTADFMVATWTRHTAVTFYPACCEMWDKADIYVRKLWPSPRSEVYILWVIHTNMQVDFKVYFYNFEIKSNTSCTIIRNFLYTWINMLLSSLKGSLLNIF